MDCALRCLFREQLKGLTLNFSLEEDLERGSDYFKRFLCFGDSGLSTETALN